jgi:hypothetical protein
MKDEPVKVITAGGAAFAGQTSSQKKKRRNKKKKGGNASSDDDEDFTTDLLPAFTASTTDHISGEKKDAVPFTLSSTTSRTVGTTPASNDTTSTAFGPGGRNSSMGRDGILGLEIEHSESPGDNDAMAFARPTPGTTPGYRDDPNSPHADASFYKDEALMNRLLVDNDETKQKEDAPIQLAMYPSPSQAEYEAAQQKSKSSDIFWLTLCFFGIMASFVCYGLLLEYTTSGGRKLHELSFLFVTSLLYTLTAAAGRYVRAETPTTIPPARFAVLGLMSMGSTYCSVRSLR